MNDIEKQIEEIKQQIKILMQEIQNKQTLLNGLVNMYFDEENENDE